MTIDIGRWLRTVRSKAEMTTQGRALPRTGRPQRTGPIAMLVGGAMICSLAMATAWNTADATSSKRPLQQASPAQIARGKYLVEFGGCNDCHTPGYFFGKADMTRYLGGSDVGFEIPKAGVFVGPNLTPDKETGLGTWTRDQILAALQKGERPDGRKLSPIMPWPAFSKLTNEDAGAIADYLMGLPAVNNKTPGPFGPDEKPPIAVMSLRLPGGQ
jgi:mono/diheme cytochrome c family protein